MKKRLSQKKYFIQLEQKGSWHLQYGNTEGFNSLEDVQVAYKNIRYFNKEVKRRIVQRVFRDTIIEEDM